MTISPSTAALFTSLGFRVDVGNMPLRVTNTEVLGKIDHHWSPIHGLVFRGSYADVDRDGIDDFGGSVARSRGTVQLRTDWSVPAAETDVFGSKWISEFRTPVRL